MSYIYIYILFSTRIPCLKCVFHFNIILAGDSSPGPGASATIVTVIVIIIAANLRLITWNLDIGIERRETNIKGACLPLCSSLIHKLFLVFVLKRASCCNVHPVPLELPLVLVPPGWGDHGILLGEKLLRL